MSKRIIVEIKAKCFDPNQIEKFLLNSNAEFKGIDHQTDTYFNTNTGRLKLRQGNIENNLIYYNRPDQKGPKTSNVILQKMDSENNLKKILEDTNGVLIEVVKERKIFFIENVKFHIDKVKNLGSFVEIEAIGESENSNESGLLEQCNYYLSLFGIKSEDLVHNSYSDMLLKLND